MTTEKSTDARQAIDRFFDRELMPLARELRGNGAKLLETSVEGKSSYYSARTRPAMDKAAFEWGGAESVEQLAVDLELMWRGSDCPQLSALAPSVARLASLLRRVEGQPGEVSQFVYVMY